MRKKLWYCITVQKSNLYNSSIIENNSMSHLNMDYNFDLGWKTLGFLVNHNSQINTKRRHVKYFEAVCVTHDNLKLEIEQFSPWPSVLLEQISFGQMSKWAYYLGQMSFAQRTINRAICMKPKTWPLRQRREKCAGPIYKFYRYFPLPNIRPCQNSRPNGLFAKK